jgi:ribosomal protein L18
MIKRFHSNQARLRRHQRIRRHLVGAQSRPRLNVFRSGHHIYAQIIDDTTGRTLVAASSLEESLKDFTPPVQDSAANETTDTAEESTPELVPVTTEAAPAPKKKSAKADTTKNAAPAKASKSGVLNKTQLPAAQKGVAKTPVEALAAIASNRKVALAREVGKLIGQRAKEQGVSRVVFDRGGYAYHGRVASLAEGAREAGLDF